MINSLVKRYFNLFTSRIYKRYVSVKESDTKTIDNFIKLLKKEYSIHSIGSDFLFTYFSFQYQYWSTSNQAKTYKSIPLGWIIGKKAFKRWIDRNFINVTDFNREFVLNAIEEESKDESDVLVDPEETYKRKFHNTQNGLVYCLEMTTLYNHRSISCLRCMRKSECKEVQKQHYPSIARKRGYLETTKS